MRNHRLRANHVLLDVLAGEAAHAEVAVAGIGSTVRGPGVVLPGAVSGGPVAAVVPAAVSVGPVVVGAPDGVAAG